MKNINTTIVVVLWICIGALGCISTERKGRYYSPKSIHSEEPVFLYLSDNHHYRFAAPMGLRYYVQEGTWTREGDSLILKHDSWVLDTTTFRVNIDKARKPTEVYDKDKLVVTMQNRFGFNYPGYIAIQYDKKVKVLRFKGRKGESYKVDREGIRAIYADTDSIYYENDSIHYENEEYEPAVFFNQLSAEKEFKPIYFSEQDTIHSLEVIVGINMFLKGELIWVSPYTVENPQEKPRTFYVTEHYVVVLPNTTPSFFGSYKLKRRRHFPKRLIKQYLYWD